MQGHTKKMQVRMDVDKSKPVQYELPLGEQLLALNPLIGKPIKLRYTGKIACVYCNRSIKKSFNQGYCYPCFTSLAQCDMCIMKPETAIMRLALAGNPHGARHFVSNRIWFIWPIPAVLRSALPGKPKSRHAG